MPGRYGKKRQYHLSVFAWSIGNEVDYPNDPYSHPVLDGNREGGFTQAMYSGYKKDASDAMRLGDIAKRLAAVVRRYDTAGNSWLGRCSHVERDGISRSTRYCGL